MPQLGKMLIAAGLALAVLGLLLLAGDRLPIKLGQLPGDFTYKGKNMTDVLDMTVDEAARFFRNVPAISDKLIALLDVGLGYGDGLSLTFARYYHLNFAFGTSIARNGDPAPNG